MYTAKIIFIDLSKAEITIETLDDTVVRSVIGGEALGAWILHTRQPAGADPLGPDNILGIIPGLLSGYKVPGSSRTMVVTKSPLTGGIGDANAGGAFSPELKACGYDGIFIKGISSEPVYLLVTDEKVELHNAAHLWGKDTVETRKLLIQEIGDPKIKVASIGPSGEKVSLISSIIMDDRAAARSGVGAVMGSKRLKSVVVRGKKKPESIQPDHLREMNKKFGKYLLEVDYFVIDVMRRLGSCGFMSLGYKVGITPSKNWQYAGEKIYPNHEKVHGDNVRRFMTKKHGCLLCPIHCGGMVKIPDGPFKVDEARLPEYETITAFGSLTMCESIEAVIKGQSICDRYGIDTISMGNVLAFAIECYEHGILTKTETDGIELAWNNPESMILLMEKTVKREGLGDILADGVKKAAERIGNGSEMYAIHIGGQELPFHDFRYESPSRGVTYIADPTPSRHERCSGGQLLLLNMSLGPYQELMPQPIDKTDYKQIGAVIAKGSKYYNVFSACGMCAYTLGGASQFPIVDIIKAITGWQDFSAQELLDTGERMYLLRHLFNLREGINFDNFKFHPRLEEPPQFDGAMRGTSIKYDWEKLRAAYWEGYGLNGKTGIPSAQRVEELKLTDIYNKIQH